jgi:YHS domain-containing protein
MTTGREYILSNVVGYSADNREVSMTHRSTSIFMIALLILLAAGTVSAGEDKAVCPVCGYIFDESTASTVMHDGTLYHFCDPGCKAYFIADPEIVTSGKVYDAVCGMEVDKAKAIRAELGGREIHFCAESCKEKYFADPEKYTINYDVVGRQVAKVSEMKHTMEYEGVTFYFMSEENKNTFAASPDKYLFADCPLSGTAEPRENFEHRMEYEGTTYYFRNEECMKRFADDPKKALEARATGKYLGCSHGDHKGCTHDKKSDAKKKLGCPHSKEHKECPHSKKKDDAKKDDAKQGISAGCGSKKDGRCYGR